MQLSSRSVALLAGLALTISLISPVTALGAGPASAATPAATSPDEGGQDQPPPDGALPDPSATTDPAAADADGTAADGGTADDGQPGGSPAPPAPAPPPDPTTTQPTGDDVPTTTTPAAEPAPTDGEPVTTTVPDGASTGGTVPLAEGVTTTTDPLVNEHAGEDAPETDETVPPPDGAYAGQEEFKPAEVLWSSVRAAEVKLAEVRVVEEDRIAVVRTIRLGRKELRAEQASLDAETQAAAADIRRAETALRERAVAAFMTDDALTNAVIGSFDAADHDQVLDLQVRRTLLGAALDQDEHAIDAYLELRASLDGRALATLDSIRLAERTLREAIVEVDLARESVIQAENELAAFRAGSAVYIDDVVFPVGDGYGRPLVDSYGFPRMPGTPDEHWHEGIDIFAPAGTPLLAAERGVVTRVGSGRLGGLTVWLRGESGTDWYYAHLRSHAPDLVPGLVVGAGHVIGFVGNTGNAISTPPHLHLEMHPGGGEPVNPYPLLKIISDRDQLER